MRRILSVLLALALCLGCVSGAAAAPAEEGLQSSDRLSAAARALFEAAGPAARGRSGDGEPVRVIVQLEGEPAAKSAGLRRPFAEGRIALRHAAFRSGLSAAGIPCTVDCEYSVLLNGFALELEPSRLEELAALPGVARVCLANCYEAPGVAETAPANGMTGAAGLQARGFTGSGRVIAVLDSGISPEHEVFRVWEGLLTAPKLEATEAAARIGELGRGTYLSDKIPFAWDYADLDEDACDDAAGKAAGHGTQVAGIAAGYARDEAGTVRFCGAAPEAQLLAMKIFSSCGDGTTNSAIWFQALEDAYRLGADVVNLSVGSPNGFTWDQELEDELWGDVYETLRQQGVLVVCSAGNKGSMADNAATWAGPGYVRADYADYGVLGAPASYGRNLAVASAENTQLMSRVLEAGDREIPFRDGGSGFFEAFRQAGAMPYAVVPEYGRPEDYAGISARGRIALVARGEISCQEKLAFAAQAGAAGLLIYDSEPGLFQPDVSNYMIPAAAISREDGAYLISVAQLQQELQPAPEPSPAASGEDLEAEAFYPIRSQAELTEGGCLILSRRCDRAFNPKAEPLNAAGNWLETQGRALIPAEGQILEAELYYEDGQLWSGGVKLRCGADGRGIVMTEDSAEDLEIEITADGAAEIRSRGSSLRYSEAQSRFRFCPPGDPLLEDPGSELLLCRRGACRLDVTRVGELRFPNRFVLSPNESGGGLSPFSSMGVTPELGLKPGLTGVGGSVCSAAAGTEDGYEIRSGTGMAAAKVSGGLACLLQYLAQTRPELGPGARADLAEALAESSARLLYDENGNPCSPRRQGAGLLDLEAAVSARACVTEPVLSLGDSAEGRFTLRFRVRSLWDKTLSYSLELTALRDELLELLRMGEGEEELGLYNSLRPQDVSGELSLLGPSLIVVPAGETVEVELELRLSEALLARMREELPNGGFLDGFLALREFLEPCDGGADCPGAAFTDMPKPGSWAHPGIDFVLRNGYFSGSSPTAFGTKGTMDRAMTVTVLYAMAGRPEPAGSSPFPDVPMGKYYSKAVTWAAENGIVAGGSDGNFKPKGNVTREQMASILLRFAEYLGLDTGIRASIEDYPDVNSVHAWARDAMGWAVGAGVLSGVASQGQRYLQPRANATRAQVAAIFMSFVNKCMNPPRPEGEAHVSFTAFVGDWSRAPVLEEHDWREIMELERWLRENGPEGESCSYAELGYDWRDIADFDLHTEPNTARLLRGGDSDRDGCYLGDNPAGLAPYDAARSCLSHCGEENVLFMRPMLLRNARRLIMTVTDAESGALYAVEDETYLRKAVWDSDYALWSPSGEFRWDGSDQTGEPLPDGTAVEIRFYANPAGGEDRLGAIPYEALAEEGGDFLAWRFGLRVDDSAPILGEPRYDPAAQTLSFQVEDEQYLAYTALYGSPEPWEEPESPEGVARWSRLWADETPGEAHSVTVENVLPGEYTLLASDYAGNETRIRLALGSEAELWPVYYVCPRGCEPESLQSCWASTGVSLRLPELRGEPEQKFYGWITEPLEGSWSWEALEEAALDEEIHLPGSQTQIWGETWFYALLREPAAWSDPAQLLVRSLEPLPDYSGVMAFGAYDRDAEADLHLLSSSGGAWYSDSQDVLRCENPDPDCLFRVEARAGGYTIRAADGRWLAAEGEELRFLDRAEPDGSCLWQIEYDPTWEIMRVYSPREPEEYTLIYDVLETEFRLIPAADVHWELRWLALYRPAVTDWRYFTAE
ncbi:MAG: S8 family serine peptidase [Oscillospiraceae bacterium]|nr:S8 family serine peptidase [Oscillospiraceae bacterium]